jgi:catabolite regulation protein CreA
MKLIGSIAIVLAALASSTDAFAVTPKSIQSLSAAATTFYHVPSRAQQMTLQASANHDDDKLIACAGSPLRSLGAMLLSVFLMWNTAGAIPPANANESKVVGQLKGSGLVFKDTLSIERFDDPKVKGVTLYISNFDRPITEKLGGNFFNDPSSSSVACAKTGPVAIADNIAKGTGGEEVFKESRSIMFKDLRVQRIYDEEKKAVIYVSFNTRLDKSDDSNKSRFKSSLCAVALEDTIPVAASAPAADVP